MTAMGLVALTMMSAQTQKRLVLIEEFTNTGCGPCASWSPVLDSAINYRLGDCIAIKYHSGYPDRNDEFYIYDQSAQQTRVNFYNVTGVPTTLVNGQDLSERSYAFLNQAIDYCMTEPEHFDLSVSKRLDGEQLSVTVKGKPLHAIGTDAKLRLYVCAIEEHIVSAVPYSNGETELNYTMRKMLTDPVGYALDVYMEELNYETEWTADCFDDLGQLGVVAFIQDITTHEVLCTAYAGPGAEGENRLALMNLIDTPDLICVPEYHGKVIFRNDGANTLTSATLNVRVNDVVKQYPWTGSLDYLDRDTLAFDGLTGYEFVGSGANQAEVWFSDINASDAVSNTRSQRFNNAVVVNYGAQLKIYTDKKPEEITWNLYNSAGDVLQHGGPYTEPRKFVTIPLELSGDDCYQLEFLDAGGDGIKGSYGNGYYQLFQVDETGKTNRVAQGDYDGAAFYLNFRLTGAPVEQASRLVLFEEFTNTSCDPCAEFSPALDKLIYDHMGEMVAITYHYNFPSAQDPFYLADPADAMARANFYGITGVPALFVIGERVGAWGHENELLSYVDGAREVSPTVDIETEAAFDADGQLKVNVSVVPRTVVNGRDLRLFVAVVEERVEWAEPAANGERSWNYVMRRLLPGSDGQPLGDGMMQVTPYQYAFAWTPQNFYDANELGIVTFVQDIATKEVLGTTYTPRPTGSTSAAKILQVSNMPDRICSPAFTSDLTVRNTGRDPLTSATINVRINGTLQQTPWTGRLQYLDIATLHTPLFKDFTLADNQDNKVEIWLSDLNGTTEESAHKSFSMKNAYQAHGAVRLTLMTDQKPEEITWTLTNSAGDVVAKGGPYTEARKKQVVDLPLTADDCYMLEFEDAGHNGINGENGRGYYALHEVDAMTGKTRLLVQSTYEDAVHDVFFSLQGATSGVVPVVAEPSSADEPAYDLLGRPATKGLVIKGNKKIINN